MGYGVDPVGRATGRLDLAGPPRTAIRARRPPTPQERVDALEEQRGGEHLLEYWTRPDTGGAGDPDDPGPPGLDPPRDGYGPPPFWPRPASDHVARTLTR